MRQDTSFHVLAQHLLIPTLVLGTRNCAPTFVLAFILAPTLILTLAVVLHSHPHSWWILYIWLELVRTSDNNYSQHKLWAMSESIKSMRALAFRFHVVCSILQEWSQTFTWTVPLSVRGVFRYFSQIWRGKKDVHVYIWLWYSFP